MYPSTHTPIQHVMPFILSKRPTSPLLLSFILSLDHRSFVWWQINTVRAKSVSFQTAPRQLKWRHAARRKRPVIPAMYMSKHTAPETQRKPLSEQNIWALLTNNPLGWLQYLNLHIYTHLVNLEGKKKGIRCSYSLQHSHRFPMWNNCQATSENNVLLCVWTRRCTL